MIRPKLYRFIYVSLNRNIIGMIVDVGNVDNVKAFPHFVTSEKQLFKNIKILSISGCQKYGEYNYVIDVMPRCRHNITYNVF